MSGSHAHPVGRVGPGIYGSCLPSQLSEQQKLLTGVRTTSQQLSLPHLMQRWYSGNAVKVNPTAYIKTHVCMTWTLHCTASGRLTVAQPAASFLLIRLYVFRFLQLLHTYNERSDRACTMRWY